ncbi:MAG: AAA family ATPase, partial [Desulfobulbaceae bacterium]|nr:AAA family ATPase [Desulfobulbaceae bacterium]
MDRFVPIEKQISHQQVDDNAGSVFNIERSCCVIIHRSEIDATNVQPESRKPLVELAREYHCLPVAVVLNVPQRVCQDRNRSRHNRPFGPHVIGNQLQQMR